MDRIKAKSLSRDLLRNRTFRDKAMIWLVISFFVPIASIAMPFFGGILMSVYLVAGMLSVALRCVRNDQKLVFEDVFKSNRMFGKFVAVYLWMLFYIFLWCLPGLIIAWLGSALISVYGGGIWGILLGGGGGFGFVFGVILVILGIAWSIYISVRKSLEYSMSFFVAIDNRNNVEFSAYECLCESCRMTAGHVGELFVTYLSFIGWMLLVPLTLGILNAFVIPYMLLTFAEIYVQLGGKEYAVPTPVFDKSPNVNIPVQPSMPVQHSIKIIYGERTGSKFPINNGEILTIGRDPAAANIVIQSPSTISGCHCTIKLSSDGSKFTVTDLSSNGTFVNSNRLPANVPYDVAPGTTVTLASKGAVISLN